MPQMTSDYQIALFTDFKEMYNDWFFAAQNVNDFTQICQVIESDTLIENLNFLETVPTFREWTDARALQGIGPSYNYSIKNKHWEVTIEIDRDTIDDNRLQLERQKIAHLGLEAGRAPWQMLINALLANGTGYDGVPMFATNHTQNGVASQSNLLTGTGTTLTAIQNDYGTAIAAARNFLDGQGRPMNLGQRGRLIVCPPALEQQFLQLLHSDTIVVSISGAGSAGNVYGPLTNQWKDTADLIVDPYLTDTDDWYLFLTAEPGLPMIYLNRQAPVFVAQDSPGAEANFMRRMLRYGADWRSQVGYGPWYLAIKVAQD